MPLYVYGCPKNPNHPRKEVTHGMKEEPAIYCDACGTKMQRIPQPFRFYLDPVTILYDWSDENWRRYKMRKQGYNAPRFSPNDVNRPIPMGGKDFEHRRAKNDTKK